jgi:hypothetical protein
MFKQNYQKVAIFAILLALGFAIGFYQQVIASDGCIYYDSCYNYPNQKDPLIQVSLSEGINSNNAAFLTGL